MYPPPQQAPAKGLQRALTVELETAEEKALVIEALDVKPPLDWAAQSESEQLKRFFAATAFLCSDAISRQASGRAAEGAGEAAPGWSGSGL